MLRLLQESGRALPLNQLSLGGEHWLHAACEHRQLELLRLYLTIPDHKEQHQEHQDRLRREVNCRNPLTGTTPLHVSVRKRLLPLAQLLLACGADPSLQVRD